MKSLLRSTVVVGAMAGAAALAPGVATAGVSIGIGVPAVIIGAGPGYVAYDEQYYYDPIYISGAWYHGPYRWRMWHGERMFFVNGRWHRNEWRNHAYPASITFSNGGYYRSGRYDGFYGAERFNARYDSYQRRMHEQHREMNSDRREDRMDERRDDRQDARDQMQDGRDDDRNDGSDRR